MLKRSVCNKLSTLFATPFSNTLFRISSIKPLFCVNKRDAFRGKVLTAQRSYGVASEWFINVVFRLVIRANTGTRRRKTRWQSDLASCCQEHQAYWRKCWANCLHRSTAKKILRNLTFLCTYADLHAISRLVTRTMLLIEERNIWEFWIRPTVQQL